MIIRKAIKSDIPDIVELLRLSLGSMTEKSETNWNWKHVDNPYGESPVLLAFEGQTLVGVRAFMCWGWTDGKREYRALRAVDTATHPDFQGRGIFKKLTLQLLDEVKAEGYDFIFNTPNSKSMPGYLKMGWEKAGKLPVRLKVFPFFGKRARPQYGSFDLADIADLSLFESIAPQSGPTYPKNYLPWRYVDNPFIQYYGFGSWSDELKCLCIFRIKETPRYNELRICELFYEGEAAGYFRKKLRKAAKAFGCTMVSSGYYEDKSVRGLLNKTMFLPSLALGLQMTYREVNHDPSAYFLPAKARNFPLGVFELF